MRRARLLLLVAVVVGLGLWIYFSERHMPTTDQAKERAEKLFPDLVPDKVGKVTVANSHGRFELVKNGASWTLAAPLADQANGSAVTGLLSTMGSLRAESTLAAKDVKAADYGVDKPMITVAAEQQGKTFTLGLGDELPLGKQRAATTGTSSIYLVSSFVAQDADKDLAGWRSTDLADVMASDVASLTVGAPDGRVALAHSGSVWTMTEPFTDLADRDRAEALVGDLNNAKIKEFLDNVGDLGSLGLASPRVRLTVVRKDKGAPLLLAFGNEREAGGKQVACKRGERVFWVDAVALSHAIGPVVDWRSKKLVSLDSWSATTLDITAGTAKLKLERKDGVWRAGSTEVDSAEVSRRLQLLSDLVVVAFDRPKPSAAPLGSFTAKTEDGTAVEATFYPGGGAGETLATVPGRTGVFAVDATKAAEALADPAALGRPKPTPAPPPTPAPTAKPAQATPGR